MATDEAELRRIIGEELGRIIGEELGRIIGEELDLRLGEDFFKEWYRLNTMVGTLWDRASAAEGELPEVIPKDQETGRGGGQTT